MRRALSTSHSVNNLQFLRDVGFANTQEMSDKRAPRNTGQAGPSGAPREVGCGAGFVGCVPGRPAPGLAAARGPRPECASDGFSLLGVADLSVTARRLLGKASRRPVEETPVASKLPVPVSVPRGPGPAWGAFVVARTGF